MISTLKIFFVLLLFAGTFFPANTQTVTVSEEVPIRSDDHFRIIGQVGDHIHLLVIKSNSLELRTYDRNMRLVQVNEPDIVGRHSRVIGQIKQGDTFLIFTQKRDGNDHFIVEWEFNERAQIVDSATIAVASHIAGFTNFRFTYSEDKSRVVFFRSDNVHDLQAFCYDLEKREIAWDRNINVEGNIRSGFRKMLVDSRGRLALVMERRERRFRRIGMQFEFFIFDSETDLFHLQEVSVPDLFSYSQDFTLDARNNTLIGAGLYYKNSSTRAEGHYIIKIDIENPKDYEFFKNPFPSDLLSKISDQNITRGAVPDIKVTDFMLRNDGGVVIFTEIQKVYERRPTYGQRTFQRTIGRAGWVDYYLEDVIITSFNPDGSRLWNNVLYKKQYSQDDDAVFSGFYIMEAPSFLRLLFNDEIGTNSTVSEYIVGANGMTERKSVLNTEYQNLRLRFRNAYQLSSTSLIIPSESKSRLNLVKVEY